MQLIYKTNDNERAHAICDLLQKRGFPAVVHGEVTARATPPTLPFPITVWVLRDDDLAAAESMLAVFFAAEATASGRAPATPMNPRLRTFLLALGAFLVTLLACLATLPG